MNQEIIKELDKILPVVVRVHGDHHPELKEVGALYEAFRAEPAPQTLQKLQEVTMNFTVPEDACPTYEKAYKHLAALAKEYL